MVKPQHHFTDTIHFIFFLPCILFHKRMCRNTTIYCEKCWEWAASNKNFRNTWRNLLIAIIFTTTQLIGILYCIKFQSNIVFLFYFICTFYIIQPTSLYHHHLNALYPKPSCVHIELPENQSNVKPCYGVCLCVSHVSNAVLLTESDTDQVQTRQAQTRLTSSNQVLKLATNLFVPNMKKLNGYA